jgi:hypothetical protein
MNRAIRMAGIVLFALSGPALAARADEKAKPVEGAWRQVEQKNGDAQDYQKMPDQLKVVDHIVGGRFVMTMVLDGKLIGLIGGRYKADKDKFTEIIEYVTGDGIPESFVGSSFDFTLKFDGDTFTKVGTIKVNGMDFKIDEKWERCKP